MKNFRLACMASLLTTSIAHAGAACNGFEITVQNNLQDKLASTVVKLNGATINPGLVKINQKSKKVFTVSGSDEGRPMKGELVFKTISFPSKTIHIEFDLKNNLQVCEHSDKGVPNAYPVSHTRLQSKVAYTIG